MTSSNSSGEGAENNAIEAILLFSELISTNFTLSLDQQETAFINPIYLESELSLSVQSLLEKNAIDLEIHENTD